MRLRSGKTPNYRAALATAMGVAGGGAILALLATFVRVPAGPTEESALGDPANMEAPGLVISRIDRLPVGDGLRERLWLLNPSPLYMPVADATGPSGLPERPGGRAAEMFAPMLVYPDRRPGRGILRPKAPATPTVAAERLEAVHWFQGMSRSGDVGGALVAPLTRAARITLYRQGGSAPEIARDLVADEEMGSRPWRPVEMNVVFDAVGPVSRPTLVTSSGDDRVDDRIRQVVGRDFLSKLSLRPGIYRIEVGP